MARNERSAGFVAFHSASGAAGQREYLLLDYGRHWDLPKGHLDAGEDDLAAAVRELQEETGLTSPRVIDGFHHEIVYFFRSPRKGLIRKTVIFFLAEVSHRQITLSDEHVGFVFLPFSDAIARLTYPSTRAVVRAAEEFLTRDFSRASRGTGERS
jgi:bis(5'-nucleosidyl)-tetraphosphatase